ncbi:MAG: A/G-specific adenine glycosylase [Paraglaciecola sp.]|nr:A/G-specific adenine glycosylase [Paraglaciecola sp.]NCT49106.1 A/G-specific adenine glycosylase [Paraglaciecola sp.]
MSANKSSSTPSFAERILAWFAQHGRKDLPWQQHKSAYSVWVSEIMLQQTQVTTVIGYYQRFMQRFPDISSLANAAQDEVLHHWTGLGYYARARNLQRAAQQIMRQHAGEFPTDIDAVIALPGIGRSTAAAILSLAGNQGHSILDGNVKRVLARHAAISGWPGDKKMENQLWALADQYTPKVHTGDYNQAMMDMGATLCTRSSPRCHACPVADDCQAYLQNRVAEFPAKKAKKTIPVRSTIMLIPSWQQHVLLFKRPASGIWGGLWGFYQIDQLHQLQTQSEALGFSEFSPHFLLPFRHTFSHFHLDIQPVQLLLAEAPNYNGVQENQQLWYNLKQPAEVGLAVPTIQILSSLNAV